MKEFNYFSTGVCLLAFLFAWKLFEVFAFLSHASSCVYIHSMTSSLVTHLRVHRVPPRVADWAYGFWELTK